MFLHHVRRYRNDDQVNFVKDKKFFDEQLAKSHYLCEDTKILIPDVVTKIIKDPNVDLQQTDKLINVT